MPYKPIDHIRKMARARRRVTTIQHKLEVAVGPTPEHLADDALKAALDETNALWEELRELVPLPNKKG